MKKSLLFSIFALTATTFLSAFNTASAQSVDDVNFYSQDTFFCQGQFLFKERLFSTEYAHPTRRVLQEKKDGQIEISVALDRDAENIHVTYGDGTFTIRPDIKENAQVLEQDSEKRYRFKRAIGTEVTSTKIKRLVPTPDGKGFYAVVEETFKTYPRERDDMSIPFVDNGFGSSVKGILRGTINGAIGFLTDGLPGAADPLTVKKLRYSVVKYNLQGEVVDQISIDEAYDTNEFLDGIASLNGLRLFDETPIYINGNSIYVRPARKEINLGDTILSSNPSDFTEDVYRVDDTNEGLALSGALNRFDFFEAASGNLDGSVQLFRTDYRKTLLDLAPRPDGNILVYASRWLGNHNPSEVVFQENLGGYTYLNGQLVESPDGTLYMNKPFLWQSPVDLDEALIWGRGRFSEVAPMHHAKVVRVAPDGDLIFVFPYRSENLVLSYAVLKIRPGYYESTSEDGSAPGAQSAPMRQKGGIVAAWEVVGNSDNDNDGLIGVYIIGNTLYLHGDTGFGLSEDDFNLDMDPTVVRIEL